MLSRSFVSDFCDPMTVACQAPLSVGFSRQEYWSGLPLRPPEDLPDPASLMSPALAGRFFNTEPLGGPNCWVTCCSVLPENRLSVFRDSQVVLVIKNPPANARDLRDAGSILGSGRSPGGGQGYPLQYSCLENPMDRVICWATVHRVGRSHT